VNPKESLSSIQKALLQIEKTLYIKQQDLKCIIDELKDWNALKQELDEGIKTHQSGEVLTFLPEYKSMVRDLTLASQEIDRIIALKQELNSSIENLIKKHEEYNSIYESWYIYKKDKVVDLNMFKQGRNCEKKREFD